MQEEKQKDIIPIKQFMFMLNCSLIGENNKSNIIDRKVKALKERFKNINPINIEALKDGFKKQKEEEFVDWLKIFIRKVSIIKAVPRKQVMVSLISAVKKFKENEKYKFENFFQFEATNDKKQMQSYLAISDEGSENEIALDTGSIIEKGFNSEWKSLLQWAVKVDTAVNKRLQEKNTAEKRSANIWMLVAMVFYIIWLGIVPSLPYFSDFLQFIQNNIQGFYQSLATTLNVEVNYVIALFYVFPPLISIFAGYQLLTRPYAERQLRITEYNNDRVTQLRQNQLVQEDALQQLFDEMFNIKMVEVIKVEEDLQTKETMEIASSISASANHVAIPLTISLFYPQPEKSPNMEKEAEATPVKLLASKKVRPLGNYRKRVSFHKNFDFSKQDDKTAEQKAIPDNFYISNQKYVMRVLTQEQQKYIFILDKEVKKQISDKEVRREYIDTFKKGVITETGNGIRLFGRKGESKQGEIKGSQDKRIFGYPLKRNELDKAMASLLPENMENMPNEVYVFTTFKKGLH